MSRKQEIYLKFLGMILPLFRNIQSQSWRHRLTAPRLYLDAELIHNLPECLVRAEFTKQDIWWMNTQVKLYVVKGNTKNCAFYDEFVVLIKELFTLVPENLRNELKWAGPQMRP